MTMNRIQDNIKRFRKDKGLTQEEVANQLYVTRQLISKWEMGKSLPNIADVERLATVFGVGINDLLDDESIRSITLSEAIQNRQKRRFHWISIPISLLAIGLGVFVLLTTWDPDPAGREITVAFCYVTEADVESGVYVFENDSIRYEIDTIDAVFDWTVQDADGTAYAIEDLVVGDNVQISFEQEPENGLDIIILDKVLDDELYGIFVSATGTDPSSLDDVASAVAGVQFVYQTETTSGWNTEVDRVYTQDRQYIQMVTDVYINLDPLKITDEARIGLIRSDGIDFVDLVDLDTQRTYTYSGAYAGDEPDITTTETVHVTYRIHIRFVPSVDSFAIYEYDQNGGLIMETALTWDDIAAFETQEATLQAYVMIKRTVVGGPYGTNELTNAYGLLRGETKTFAFADDWGMIHFYDFVLD
jgi:transcriptional regulator with XRE-family HTH domain